jgi:hypothetical protein
MPVSLFEFLLFTLVLVTGVTQVLWPIWRGTPLFPILNSKERRLLREAERERQRQLEMRLTHDLTRQTLREADFDDEEPYERKTRH